MLQYAIIRGYLTLSGIHSYNDNLKTMSIPSKRSAEASRLIQKLEEVGKSNHPLVQQLREFVIAENRRVRDNKSKDLIVDGTNFLLNNNSQTDLY